METIKNRLKAIALLLAGLILIQSCVVYHNNPTSLEQASREHIKTKVTGTNGETAEYDYISYNDGQFFGISHKSGKFITTPLYQKDLTKVLTKDKSGSTWATVALITVPVIAIIVIVGLSMEDAFDWNIPEENGNQ